MKITKTHVYVSCYDQFCYVMNIQKMVHYV